MFTLSQENLEIDVHIDQMETNKKRWWEATRYKYFVTVLK